jgi:hypothetical protein
MKWILIIWLAGESLHSDQTFKTEDACERMYFWLMASAPEVPDIKVTHECVMVKREPTNN